MPSCNLQPEEARNLENNPYVMPLSPSSLGPAYQRQDPSLRQPAKGKRLGGQTALGNTLTEMMNSICALRGKK